ncbi:MAG: hypothetical protein EXR72_11850 [Myxococcales bacterium]|nr:hypothetical protein [Myxococcales bacterium]
MGWLHRPPPGQGVRLGLVLCNPFGYEAICAHRTLLALAEAGAAAGLPSLRFDYDGTGDSAGDDRDPDRVGAWARSIGHAIDLLRAQAGVERVCLLGVRLGALLASVVAAERDDCAGLVLLAPVVSGKAWLREQRALQGALGLAPAPTGLAAVPSEGNGQESVGFLITEETRTALSAIDLSRLERPPAPRLLVLDRADLPVAARSIERVRAQGARVDPGSVHGYTEMVLDPHDAVVPATTVAEVGSWLRALALEAPSAEAAVAARGSVAPVRAGLTEGGTSIVEEPLSIGIGCFLIATQPANAPRRRRGILLLNAGAIHHVGPNRLYVALARRWAALGHVVARLDLAGLGESPARVGERDNVVYPERALEDVSAALAWLGRQPGVLTRHAVGLCSGGYHAWKAAVAGQPVDGVVVINPLTFFWKPGMPLDFAPHRLAIEAQRYARSARSLASWWKLLRGEARFDAVLHVVTRRAASLAFHRARSIARRVGVTLGDDLAAELESVARRGVAIAFLFAAGDPGIELLRVQGGHSVEALQRKGALTIDTIAGPDHTFTPLWSHPPFAARLGALLDGIP